MKRLYILLVVIGIAFFNVQQANAQTDNNEEKIVYKTTKSKTPDIVKETLNDYSGYKIENEVTYAKKNNSKIYRFKVTKGNWSHYILIDEKGKMLGIETDEGEH